MFKINKKNNSLSNDLYISSKYINQCRDWLVILLLSFVIVLSFIVFDYVIYKKIIKGEMYVSVEENELILEKLDKTKINDLISDFDKKVEYISNIKIEKSPDPSI